MARVRIDVQNQQGGWHRYVECHDSGSGSTVNHYLQQATQSALARNSGKARAVDVDTGAVIDIRQD